MIPIDERYARVRGLLKLPKSELLRTVRQYWGGGVTPPESWTKGELAESIADMEVSREKSAAYGNVPMLDGLPMHGTRPRCGGVDCEGHPLPARPWTEVRDRHRAKGDCVGDMPEPTGPAQARVSFKQQVMAQEFERPNTAMRFQQGDTAYVYRWRRPDYTVDETVWWTADEEDARFAFCIPSEAVEVVIP